MGEKYYYTALPRIPVAVKKKIEENVAPLVQYRRRSIANSKILHAFREPNTLIEACSNGTWLEGHTISLDERIASRIVVRVKLEDGSEETLHVGKVILREDRVGAGVAAAAEVHGGRIRLIGLEVKGNRTRRWCRS
jgi:hypothetical protein